MENRVGDMVYGKPGVEIETAHDRTEIGGDKDKVRVHMVFRIGIVYNDIQEVYTEVAE